MHSLANNRDHIVRNNTTVIFSQVKQLTKMLCDQCIDTSHIKSCEENIKQRLLEIENVIK